MKSLGLRRYALTIGAAAAMLAGCGGSQPPIGATGAMTQTSSVAAHAAYGKSWMLPEAQTKDLLYAANAGNQNDVLVHTFPKAKHVGTLTGFDGFPTGICANLQNGNVFVVVQSEKEGGLFFEYAHGGSQPIAKVNEPGSPTSCAVDPNTGDLAVVNEWSKSSNLGNVAIYANLQGTPNIYTDPAIPNPLYGAYDMDGNLFIDGADITNAMAELPSGASSFEAITLDKTIYPQSLQWLNGILVTYGTAYTTVKEEPLYQISISGTNGTVRGPIELSDQKGRNPGGQLSDWVQGTMVIGPWRAGSVRLINFWKYPSGGLPKKVINTHGGGGSNIKGVVVSPYSPSKQRQ